MVCSDINDSRLFAYLLSSRIIIPWLEKRHLQELKEDKATGPDLLSAKLLKKCAGELAVPVAKLTRSILSTGKWPIEWRVHWIVPLYKK